MIKKLIIFIISFFVLCTSVYAEDDFNLDNFIDKSLEHMPPGTEVEIVEANYCNNLTSLSDYIFSGVKKWINDIIAIFLIIILISVVTSVLKTFVTSDTVAEAASFSSYLICSLCFAYEFKHISDIGIEAIRDVCQYMNLAVPGIAALLASSGYASTATSMHGVYIIASNVIAFFIDRCVIPAISFCGAVTLSNAACNIKEFENISKLIIKSLKYIIGFALTIFSTLIGFIGLSSSTADGMIVKTAKYAVSNFIPIVGGYLADTLNSVIYTSVVMKNTVGIISVITIGFICFLPIAKIFIMSFFTKITSYFVSMLQHENLAKTLETLSEIISFIGSILIFVTVVFIILAGIISSIGV